MTVRFHLFPFRTQKLSSLVPKIVRDVYKRQASGSAARLEKRSKERKGNPAMEKIKMTTPLVEMDGDEMTRIRVTGFSPAMISAALTT